jgi:peptide/nickel transport system substrate-binding protein
MKVFDSVYYSFSPQVAEYERAQPWMQSTVKLALYPLFGILMGAEHVHAVTGGGEIGAILAGLVTSVLIGAVYLTPLGYLASRFNPRSVNKLLAIIVCVAAAALSLSVVELGGLLSLSTVIFVLVITAASAIAAAQAIKYIVHRW